MLKLYRFLILLVAYVYIILTISTSSAFQSEAVITAFNEARTGILSTDRQSSYLSSDTKLGDAWWININPSTENIMQLTWARTKQPEGVPPHVNVLAPTCFSIIDNGSGVPTLVAATPEQQVFNIEAYVAEAHANNAEVWATVMAQKRSMNDALMSNKAYQKSIIDTTAEFITKYNLDGINLDVENLDPSLTDALTEFVAACATAWKPLDITLSVDVNQHSMSPDPTNPWQSYNRKALAEVVDYVAVMSYDQHLPSSNSAGPVAALNWTEDRLQRLLEEVPSSKVLLGIPFYGRDFPAHNDASRSPAWIDGTANVKTIYKSDIESLLSDNLYARSWGTYYVNDWVVKNEYQQELGVYYIEFVDQNNLVHQIWYEEETSLKARAALVNKYHLAGIAAWSQGQGRDPFWVAMNEELQ